MTDMTPEEYKDRLRRIEADIEDAKKALNLARGYYDRKCDELSNLRIAYREQKTRARHANP